MSLPMTMLIDASPYHQPRAPEKAFVDEYVRELEREAARTNDRISNALHRPIAPAVIEASRGMLERALVRAAIAQRVEQIARDTELTHARITKELMLVAFSSMGDYCEAGQDGQPYFDLTRLTPEQWRAIAQIEITETQTRVSTTRQFKIKLHPKLDALDKLARHTSYYDEDNATWRESIAKPQQAGIAANASTAEAADAYARLIGG